MIRSDEKFLAEFHHQQRQLSAKTNSKGGTKYGNMPRRGHPRRFALSRVIDRFKEGRSG